MHIAHPTSHLLPPTSFSHLLPPTFFPSPPSPHLPLPSFQVLTAGWDRLACIWDVDTGELLQQVNTPLYPPLTSLLLQLLSHLSSSSSSHISPPPALLTPCSSKLLSPLAPLSQLLSLLSSPSSSHFYPPPSSSYPLVIPPSSSDPLLLLQLAGHDEELTHCATHPSQVNGAGAGVGT